MSSPAEPPHGDWGGWAAFATAILIGFGTLWDKLRGPAVVTAKAQVEREERESQAKIDQAGRDSLERTGTIYRVGLDQVVTKLTEDILRISAERDALSTAWAKERTEKDVLRESLGARAMAAEMKTVGLEAELRILKFQFEESVRREGAK